MLSIRQACRSLDLSRTVYHYRPNTTRDEPVISALQAAAERYPRYGFPELFQILRRQGYPWNHKGGHRINCLLRLNFRRKGKQRLLARNLSPLATPEALNQSWSVDFMHDALICGRCFRTFNVIYDFNREALPIEIDFNLPAQRVVRVLDRFAANRGNIVNNITSPGSQKMYGTKAGLFTNISTYLRWYYLPFYSAYLHPIFCSNLNDCNMASIHIFFIYTAWITFSTPTCYFL